MTAQIFFTLVGFGLSDDPCQPISGLSPYQAAAEQTPGHIQGRSAVEFAWNNRHAVILLD
jgi:hypothetical protein